jgi:hypothetical protein
MLSEWTIFEYYCDDDAMGYSTFDFSKDMYFDISLNNCNICILNKTFLSKSVSKIFKSNTINTVHEFIDHNDKIDMTDPYNLYNFIKEGIDKCPSNKYCLFINCHSQGWFMKHFKYDKLTVTYNDLFKKVKENNIFFEFIVLNSCHTATLELMYEFRNITNYLIGSENPTPFYPHVFSQNTINILSSNTNVKDICIELAKDYIHINNNPSPRTRKHYVQGEPDISVIDVKRSESLINSIIQFDMSKIRLKDLHYYRICPDDIRYGQEAFVVYDLYYVISHYFKNDKNYKNFINEFNKALIYYDQSNNLKKESTSKYSTGIGYTPCPYEHHSRGISYIKMDIYKYNEKLLSNCDILEYN